MIAGEGIVPAPHVPVDRTSNEIVLENQLPGNPPAEWQISGAGDLSIQGFATDMSVDQGGTISFKITCPVSYRIDIYRLGYYGGLGARKVATLTTSHAAQNQPACINEASTGLIDCGNWALSDTWNVPAGAVSGVYIARIARIDTGGASHIPFIVRDDDGASDILMQTADTTWQAYNRYGGNSLYSGSPAGRAYKVSYNRPFITRSTEPEDWVFNAEHPMIRWLESNGYDVSYCSGIDTHRSPALLLDHGVFVSIGHDEYWSGDQRANVEAARDAGVHLAFFSGNEVFWKTRWETSIDGSATPNRTLVCYKETHAGAKIDPLPDVWTGTWRDPRFSPPADGGRPENALTGTIFTVNCCTYAIEVPSEYGAMRVWRNTGISELGQGNSATLTSESLGYEWDEALDNGHAPPGLVRLSRTDQVVPQHVLDNGSNYGPAPARHALTLYRAPSGALVFGAGTIQWSWGLDGEHDRGTSIPDIRMQQATVNLFADMGVHPETLQPGLVHATESTDSTPPGVTILSPANNGEVEAGELVTISGIAVDGEGVVGAVEVSVDDGQTWRAATGWDEWTFAWTPVQEGSASIRVRGADDSGNLSAPSPPTIVEIIPAQPDASHSLFDLNPAVGNDPNDSGAVELGVKFSCDVAGAVTALRFYKHPSNMGTHVGSLWATTGELLARVTYTGETASGWQEQPLDAPVPLTPGQSYIASYHTTTGHYAFASNYFAVEHVNDSLRAPSSAASGGNGVYKYGPAPAFPTDTFNASNYWVDVVVTTDSGPDETPPTVIAVAPTDGTLDAPIGSTVSAVFSEPIALATLDTASFVVHDDTGGADVPGVVSYVPVSRTAVFTPSAPLDYSHAFTATLAGAPAGSAITDVAGNPLAADVMWMFTTASPPPPPPDEGPGGPILVVASTTNPFGRFYAEILRAEGLNAFTVTDVSLVTPAVLDAHEVVILAEFWLTQPQADMLVDWVNAGGRLIAMRPDAKLHALLGVAPTGGTFSEGYIQVHTESAPGAGIVADTMQYHGSALELDLAGATEVADLFSTPATATTHSAVTWRTVGANGGIAAAFAFDLAKSVVFTRQGNPAWAGQERDGIAPLRSSDLFYGNAAGDPQPDWVDLNKVAIPQADEHQRLLANMIHAMMVDRVPMPRFWYFPRGLKAVVVMTGDDHANNGTQGRYDQYNELSEPGCSVEDWECIRCSSYIFLNTPITNAVATAFDAQGFEIAVHPFPACGWQVGTYATGLAAELAQFAANWPGLPPIVTNRTHCIAWSDWATQPKVEAQLGIRMDTNYYYWPPGWVADRPGVFTGSGMAMRFADADGTMIDCYQLATQMTDESGQSYPYHADTLLDRALGPQGFYGAFCANMHTDTANHPGSNAIVASAIARDVPVIAAGQLLTWVDGRNGSSFQELAWDGSHLSFTIELGAGSRGIEAMVPKLTDAGAVQAITGPGGAVAYEFRTVKGVDYVVFPGSPGAHTVTYASPPACTGDVNGDGDTNVSDFNILASHFGQPVAPNTNGDLTGDGVVNVADFNILAGDFGCNG